MNNSNVAMMEHRSLGLAGALRGIRWPQIRNTMLFGLGAMAFSLLINVSPVMQFLRVMPPHLYLLGAVVDFQIKAFVLLVAIDDQPDPYVDPGSRAVQVAQRVEPSWPAAAPDSL